MPPPLGMQFWLRPGHIKKPFSALSLLPPHRNVLESFSETITPAPKIQCKKNQNILGGWRNQLGQYFFDMLYRAVDRSQLGPCRHHIFVHIDSKTSSLLQKIQSVYFVPWVILRNESTSHIEYAHDEHHRSPSLYVSPEPVVRTNVSNDRSLWT